MKIRLYKRSLEENSIMKGRESERENSIMIARSACKRKARLIQST